MNCVCLGEKTRNYLIMRCKKSHGVNRIEIDPMGGHFPCQRQPPIKK